MKKILLYIFLLTCAVSQLQAQTYCGSKFITVTLTGIGCTNNCDDGFNGQAEAAVSEITADNPLDGAPPIGEKFCHYYYIPADGATVDPVGPTQFAAFTFSAPPGCTGGSGNLPDYLSVFYDMNEDDGIDDDCDYDSFWDQSPCSQTSNLSLLALAGGNGTLTPIVTCGTWNLQFQIVVSDFVPGGGNFCIDPIKICTDASLTFNAQIEGIAESGNNYGCLSTQPRPTWFYLETGVAGNIDMSLAASADVDFALWGPYADLAAATAACGNLPAPVDCSYSTSATEAISIPTSTAGQIWLMVVTNYAGTTQTFTLSKTGGSGDTDCTGVACPDGEVTLDYDTAVDCNSTTGTLTYHLTITNPGDYTGPFTV